MKLLTLLALFSLTSCAPSNCPKSDEEAGKLINYNGYVKVTQGFFIGLRGLVVNYRTYLDKDLCRLTFYTVAINEQGDSIEVPQTNLVQITE